MWNRGALEAELADLRSQVKALKIALDLRIRLENLDRDMQQYCRCMYGRTSYVQMDQIALRILCARASEDKGLAIDDNAIRRAFKSAYRFQQVSADAYSSPEPEWLVF